MKINCSVIRDLLPLYADEVCSEESRGLVQEHLQECPGCSDMLRRLQETEIEEKLQDEKNGVIQYGTRWFKRRSTIIGATVAGLLMIPILVSLIVNLSIGM
ncbi:MAG: zf-HC2 domain-containing protein, partial [Thermoguttaceae bacterium]|nr:zf-HC2 domain-containing protein [Thermoguttaceae bacterium]